MDVKLIFRVIVGVTSAAKLEKWLKEHPKYEVVKPNSIHTIKVGGKMVKAIQTPMKQSVSEYFFNIQLEKK